jgi:hypothetical protein
LSYGLSLSGLKRRLRAPFLRLETREELTPLLSPGLQTRYYGALYELTYVYFRDGCVERVEYRKP